MNPTIDRYDEEVQFKFLLVDQRQNNHILKASRISHKEAQRRNSVLSGTGISWVRAEAFQ